MQLDLPVESACEVGDNDKSKIDKDFIQKNISDNSSKRNLTKLPTLASVCDRYGVSNHAGAATASATLVDYAIITKVDKAKLLNHRNWETRGGDAERRGEKQSLEI